MKYLSYVGILKIYRNLSISMAGSDYENGSVLRNYIFILTSNYYIIHTPFTNTFHLQ